MCRSKFNFKINGKISHFLFGKFFKIWYDFSVRTRFNVLKSLLSVSKRLSKNNQIEQLKNVKIN